MSHFTTKQTADRAGITVRHLQRLLKSGDGPHGVTKTSGGQWRIPASPAVRKWCRRFKRWGGKPVKEPVRRKFSPLKSAPYGDGRKHELPSSPSDQFREIGKRTKKARTAIEEVHALSIGLGMMLWSESEQVRGSRWRSWLAANGIHPNDARRLINLAKHDQRMRDKGSGIGIDSRRLKQLGITDKGEMKGSSKPKTKIDSGEWMGWVGNLRGWWTKTTKDRPIDSWEPHERQAVKNQLGWIVDFHGQLED